MQTEHDWQYYITLYDGRFNAIMAGIMGLANRVNSISRTLAIGDMMINYEELLRGDLRDISRFLSREEIQDATRNFIIKQRTVWEERFTKALEYINNNF